MCWYSNKLCNLQIRVNISISNSYYFLMGKVFKNLFLYIASYNSAQLLSIAFLILLVCFCVAFSDAASCLGGHTFSDTTSHLGWQYIFGWNLAEMQALPCAKMWKVTYTLSSCMVSVNFTPSLRYCLHVSRDTVTTSQQTVFPECNIYWYSFLMQSLLWSLTSPNLAETLSFRCGASSMLTCCFQATVRPKNLFFHTC